MPNGVCNVLKMQWVSSSCPQHDNTSSNISLLCQYLVYKRVRTACALVISGYDRSIYHLLSSSFGQCIAVAQIVHFNILDIVSVCNVDFTIDIVRT
jgi:hypothetical protein